MGFILKGCQQGRTALRFGHELQDGSGDDAEHALTANPEIPQIITCGKLTKVGAPAHKLACGQEAFQPHNIVTGDAILCATHAARVARDGPADGGELMAGGVGRVEPTLFLGGLIDGGDGCSRLDVGDASGGVYCYLIPLGKIYYPAALNGGGRARGRGSRATDGNGDAQFVGQFQGLGNGLVVRGEYDSLRQKG